SQINSFFCKYYRILNLPDHILLDLVACRMREIREQHNHTQEFLTENAHLHLSHYEHGRKLPTLGTIIKFCKYYNLSLKEFFGEMTYPKEPKK
ncbi:helix-turn-helix domain-containing protein, partial [Alistipes finegoldii]